MKRSLALLALAFASTGIAQTSQVQKWEYARMQYLSLGKSKDETTLIQSWYEQNREVVVKFAQGKESQNLIDFYNLIFDRKFSLKEATELQSNDWRLFNMLGERGWELVDIVDKNVDVSGLFESSRTFYFKRQVGK